MGRAGPASWIAGFQSRSGHARARRYFKPNTTMQRVTFCVGQMGDVR